MTLHRVFAALLISAAAFSSCSPNGAPPPKTPPPTEAQQHEAAVRSFFQRPEIKHYMMLSYSFIGGMPEEIAGYLREVEQLEADYVVVLQESPNGTQPVIEAHQAFQEFARVAAELYEVMAAGSAHVKDMREGLVISDDALRDEYNRRVDEVNGARDAFEAAIQALTPEQRQSFARMGLELYVKK